MKESKAIQINADLIVQGNNGAEVSIQGADNALKVDYKHTSAPVVSFKTLRKLWGLRKKKQYIAQDIFVSFNSKPIISTKSKRIIYHKPFFLLGILIKSLFIK